MHTYGVLYAGFDKNLSQLSLDRKRNFEELQTQSHELDTVINFKVNSAVKAQFTAICKNSHSTPSRELKLFMLQVIKQGKIYLDAETKDCSPMFQLITTIY